MRTMQSVPDWPLTRCANHAVVVEDSVLLFCVVVVSDLLNSSYLQDATGIFWDNDSLAALLALELKADLLILLSDVEGLYTGPPSDSQSQLIHTYIKEQHENTVTFGEKSRVGRGGMTAKVFAAWNAAAAGIPVIITR